MSRKNRIISEEKCQVRVIQVKRGPGKSPSGIHRRPKLIKEVVAAWYHRCDWCQGWFEPAKGNQRYCTYACRHSAFRERQRVEIAALRSQKRKK